MQPASELETLAGEHREAIGAFLSDARRVPAARWAQPRSPGKWSPGQVTEHLARAFEVNRGVLHGAWPGRTLPRLLRPVVRAMLRRTVLRRGRFGPGGKSPGPFQPGASPAGQDDLTARLQKAAASFETELANAVRAGQTTVDHPIFGRIRLLEFLQLNVIHTRHHRQQLPAAG